MLLPYNIPGDSFVTIHALHKSLCYLMISGISVIKRRQHWPPLLRVKCILLSNCSFYPGPVISKFINVLRELATFKELLRSQVSPWTRMLHFFLGVSIESIDWETFLTLDLFYLESNGFGGKCVLVCLFNLLKFAKTNVKNSFDFSLIVSLTGW